ncbi:MAG: YceI family protein [Gracilimonas sp.]|uniref:YceI family protein n=1 Tax=Gracilimonas TaxID=649462 RepID=UPI001B2BB0C8|nr:YceI family protein [Gracilimonas sp.]MBO6584775.1 YceI family protein [Gracilimonas sp.]MBO6615954.1 YceI family protein [Gracilimonas sp.]
MATWNIDPTHSEIQFKVKHLVISTVTGNFKSFNGALETEGDSFENASVTFEADIDSITTNNEDRDAHLKSDDFFNAKEFPKLKFESTSFKNTGEDTYELTGNLTIRDITKEVTLNAEHGGTVDDPYGQTKAGFEINGSINRKEFGLKWSAVTEAGSVVVADEVKLHLNVQVVESEPVEA